LCGGTVMSSFYVEGVPGKIKVLSWNELEAFRSCPLYFRYECRGTYQPERFSAVRAFEKGIRFAVNEYYERYFADEAEKAEFQDPMDAYRLGFDYYPTKELHYRPGESQQVFEAMAGAMLDAFRESPAASPDEELIAVGYRFHGKLCDGFPPLQSYADLVLSNKSCTSIFQVLRLADQPWTAADLEARKDELLLLGETARLRSKGAKPKLRFLIITKSQQPVVQLLDVPFDAKAVSRAKAVFAEICKAISAERYFPNPVPAKCEICGYSRRCARWRGR